MPSLKQFCEDAGIENPGSWAKVADKVRQLNSPHRYQPHAETKPAPAPVVSEFPVSGGVVTDSRNGLTYKQPGRYQGNPVRDMSYRVDATPWGTKRMTMIIDYVDGATSTQVMGDVDLSTTTGVQDPASLPPLLVATSKQVDKQADKQAEEKDPLIRDLMGYAAETQHGPNHVNRWKRALTRLGHKTDQPPMTDLEAALCYNSFSKARWGPVLRAFAGDPTEHAEWREGNALAAACEAAETPYYVYRSGIETTRPPFPGTYDWRVRDDSFLPSWFFDVPGVSYDEGKLLEADSTVQVGASYYGLVVYVKNRRIIARRQQSPDEHTHLPEWDYYKALNYYNGRGIASFTKCWLDGQAMTRAGYTDDGTTRGTPVARAKG